MTFNEITNEVTPYLDMIPGSDDDLDLGAPANMWHHIYMGGRLEFRAIEAQGAADTAFRIFRDADGMTWQLGLEGASDFGRISFVDKDNVERVEFDWNSAEQRTNFNFIPNGLGIRTNASSVDGIVIYPPGNVLSSLDTVIDVNRTGLASDEGLQIMRGSALKIDITSNIAFSNITTFTPNANINMSASQINNTGSIDTAADSTYDIGQTGTRYANVYADDYTGTNFVNGLGEAINLSSSAVNIITTAGQDINFLIGASADYVMNDTALTAGHPIIMTTAGDYIQMKEDAGDPAAGTTSGKFYVKVVGGLAQPWFIGDGTAAFELGSGGGAGDKISEGNSSVEVVDAGTGTIDFEVDGSDRMNLIATQLGLGVDIDMNTNNIFATGDVISGTDVTHNLGSTALHWASCFFSTLNIGSSTAEFGLIRADANGLDLRAVASGDSVDIQTEGDNTRARFNATDIVFFEPFEINDVMLIDGGNVIKAHDTVECGFMVTSDAGAIGDRGTMQAPVSDTVTVDKDVLDDRFGHNDGAFGFIDTGTGNITLYFRQADANWAAVSLTRDTGT